MTILNRPSGVRTKSSWPIYISLLVLSLSSQSAAQNISKQKPGQIDPGSLREVREGLHVVEDRNWIPVVPNVGIVTGSKAVLVVDTGIDRRNGEAVFAIARKIARGRKIYVTSTHFHPEHGFGAVAFKGRATLIYNQAQRAEFVEKRGKYVKLFTDLGLGTLVDATRFVMPDRTYADRFRLDLGGRVVDLYADHAGHTRGDQIIHVPDMKTVFMGDLLETASFPIFPWYPEIGDTDVSPAKWLTTLRWAVALDPAIVVPGHGPVGTKADLDGLSRYIAGVRDDVLAQCASAGSVADLQRTLEPKLKAQHPDWHLSEWVGPSISAFAKDYCPSLLRRP